jgi:hypothetical protein
MGLKTDTVSLECLRDLYNNPDLNGYAFAVRDGKSEMLGFADEYTLHLENVAQSMPKALLVCKDNDGITTVATVDYDGSPRTIAKLTDEFTGESGYASGMSANVRTFHMHALKSEKTYGGAPSGYFVTMTLAPQP